MATVLVVDDEPDVVELVAFNLRKFGHEVLTASDGSTALEKARLLLPDLILLDLMVPELDGFTVCESSGAKPPRRTSRSSCSPPPPAN